MKPGYIIGWFGDMGSGKSLSMTRYAFAYQRMGWKIYCNYGVDFPHVKVGKDFLKSIIEENKIVEGDDKVLFCIDEFDIYVDSRSPMNKDNRVISWFLKQIRKQTAALMYTTQFEHQVDKRLRGLTRYEVICSSKDLNIHTPNGIKSFKIIYNDFYFKDKKIRGTRFFGDKWFNLYDTKELIVD